MYRLTEAQRKNLVFVVVVGFVMGVMLTLLVKVLHNNQRLTRHSKSELKVFKGNVEMSTAFVSSQQSRSYAEAAQTSGLTVGSFTSWFDPTVLLRKTMDPDKRTLSVQEGGAMDSAKRMLEPEQRPSKPQAEVLAISERRKVLSVGCFYEYGSHFALTESLPQGVQNSMEACIKRCAAKDRRYASISDSKNCRCGISVSRSSLMISVNPGLCNSKCKVDDGRICGGDKYASVYRIAEHFTDYFSLQRILDISSGCFEKRKDMDKRFSKTSLFRDGNAAQCLIYCEEANYVFAFWEKTGECRCGQFDAGFPLSELGHPVEDNLCYERSCKQGSDVCIKKYIGLIRTNREDERCDAKQFLSRRNPRLTALVSFPGSGNTWVRYLVETATGIYSGSVYRDQELYMQGFIGELLDWNSRKTSVIKTHQYTEDDVKKFEAAILIVRNPYDAIMAEFNRVSGGHVGYADAKLFKQQEWTYFVAYKITKWFGTIMNYSIMDKLLVVYFEDIVKDPTLQVKKIVEFLSFPQNNLAERVSCLERNLSGNFKRVKRKLYFDPFSRRLKEIVNLHILRARKILIDRNLPQLPSYEK